MIDVHISIRDNIDMVRSLPTASFISTASPSVHSTAFLTIGTKIDSCTSGITLRNVHTVVGSVISISFTRPLDIGTDHAEPSAAVPAAPRVIGAAFFSVKSKIGDRVGNITSCNVVVVVSRDQRFKGFDEVRNG